MNRWKTVSISCKAKELLDEIAKVYACNKSSFLANVIEKEYKKMKSKEEED